MHPVRLLYRRRWRSMMLQHPVDLVFSDLIKEQHGEWLAATSVPLRTVCGTSGEDVYAAWDKLEIRAVTDVRCFAASRDTLQVITCVPSALRRAKALNSALCFAVSTLAKMYC